MLKRARHVKNSKKPAKGARREKSKARSPRHKVSKPKVEKLTADERRQKAVQEHLAALNSKRAGAGRPTAYDPKFADRAVEFMSLGYSLTAFAGEIGVCRDTVYEWEKNHSEFSDAIKVARSKRVAALEDRLLFGLPEQTGSTIFALKNACPDEWRKDTAIQVDVNNSVQLNRPVEEWGEAEIRAELARRGALPGEIADLKPKALAKPSKK